MENILIGQSMCRLTYLLISYYADNNQETYTTHWDNKKEDKKCAVKCTAVLRHMTVDFLGTVFRWYYQWYDQENEKIGGSKVWIFTKLKMRVFVS